MAINSRGHRKQFFLFLIAVILPSLLLIIFAWRMIRQERELAQKRMVDERQRMAREIGQILLMRLEKIKLQEAGASVNWTELPDNLEYINPEVVLIAQMKEAKLRLPWEFSRRGAAFKQILSDSNFAIQIQQAEQQEFEKKNFSRAAELYRQLMDTTREPIQKSYAHLLLGRVLSKTDRKKEALAHFRIVLKLPLRIKDEYGIPFCLYAARPLLEAGTSLEEVSEVVRSEIEAKRWLSPAEAYLLKDLAEKLTDTPEPSVKDAAHKYNQQILDYIKKVEQSLALQRDFQTLAMFTNQETQKNETIWVPYGEGPWLISLASPLAGTNPLLIVVEAEDILASLKSDSSFLKTYPRDIRFIQGESSEGEFLGPNFRGLKIAFEAGELSALSKQWRVQPAFYLFALLLVLSVTLFGAYLLWRDVRRDLRMAELRSQFVSSVSHELKTPLTAIRMFAETLRLGRSKDLKTQNEYLDTIVNESERLTRLLNNVLDFSKIEQGKRIYRPALASLADIIQAAARTMEYPLSQQGFRLHVQADEGLPEVRVDRDAIEQAILNLLHNAMKYSGESRDIELRLQKKDSYALIQVVDRGVGIDPQEKERIFEKFYRIASEENKRLPGTGLGLTLVSHIIKAHGGHIEVESAPGRGSTFSIYLPLESIQ
jgi:signal transduction histidine kinase